MVFSGLIRKVQQLEVFITLRLLIFLDLKQRETTFILQS